MRCLTFVSPQGQTRYVSCLSVLPPSRVSYSSSERPVDALLLPDPAAQVFQTLLNNQFSLGCDIACEAVTAHG